jgi:hypothetical protein
MMRRLMQRSVWPWWLVALVYYFTACLMHLQFSLWLVRQRETVLGKLAYADLMPGVVVTAGAGLAWALARSLRKSPRPKLTAGFWLLWLAVVVLIDHTLTFSINEYAHYPQYALLAWLLARAMDPQRSRWRVGRVLFWSTLMGMGDEVLQYLWITTSYSDYLDFNDFVVNLVAACAGVLLYYGPSAAPPPGANDKKPVLEYGVVGTALVLLALALHTGYLAQTPASKIVPGGIVSLEDGSRRLYLQRGPAFYGSWQNGNRHGRYFVLPPMPGLLALTVLGLLFSAYGTCRVRSPGAEPERAVPANGGPPVAGDCHRPC